MELNIIFLFSSTNMHFIPNILLVHIICSTFYHNYDHIKKTTNTARPRIYIVKYIYKKRIQPFTDSTLNRTWPQICGYFWPRAGCNGFCLPSVHRYIDFQERNHFSIKHTYRIPHWILYAYVSKYLNTVYRFEIYYYWCFGKKSNIYVTSC